MKLVGMTRQFMSTAGYGSSMSCQDLERICHVRMLKEFVMSGWLNDNFLMRSLTFLEHTLTNRGILEGSWDRLNQKVGER